VWNTITPGSWRPKQRHPSGVDLLCGQPLPHFVLSSTGPLLQSWFTKPIPSHLTAVPLLIWIVLGLLSYPFLVSVGFLRTQDLWSVGFLPCSRLAFAPARGGEQHGTETFPAPAARDCRGDSVQAKPASPTALVSLAAWHPSVFWQTNQICRM